MSSEINLLSVTDGSKKYGKKLVLNQVTFELPAGRIVGLLGPNGAGKTTLLNSIMNINRLDSGQILICGMILDHHSKSFVSYLPDTNHLFTWMSVRDAIRYYQDMFPDFSMDRAQELTDLLSIKPQERIKTLSAGELERLLIMLTFSRKVRLYILDEPLGGIDPVSKSKIIKVIFSKLDEGSTIFLSTHLVKDVEHLLDYVLFLDRGKIVFSDNTDHIREVRGQSIEDCYMEVFQNA